MGDVQYPQEAVDKGQAQRDQNVDRTLDQPLQGEIQIEHPHRLQVKDRGKGAPVHGSVGRRSARCAYSVGGASSLASLITEWWCQLPSFTTCTWTSAMLEFIEVWPERLA